MLVLFWTDVLIFLLVGMVLIFGLYARRREHLRAPWREVGRSGVAMGSLVVLGLYITIGLLDSLHFRPALNSNDDQGRVQYANEVLSVFDWLVTPLRMRGEKTYSAPFAAYES